VQLIVRNLTVVYGLMTGRKIIQLSWCVKCRQGSEWTYTAVIMKNISLMGRLLCSVDSVLAVFGVDTVCYRDRRR
jgi:hypothetical protein